MTAVEPIDLLRKNLELAKEQLKSVDSDIKRLTGRDPAEDRFLHRVADSNFKRPNGKPNFRAPIVRNALINSFGQEKQKVPEDDLQVSLASSVVRVNESRSRLEAAKGMRKSDKDRGRRMLGILQNTLNQFKAESATSQPQLAKRRQVDAKVEAREKKEKESLRRERAQLFRSRREQQIEINVLQQKMRMAKALETWKTEMEKMIGFCRTDTKPPIFYRPRVHNEESKHRVAETAKVIHDIVRHRQRKMDLMLEEYASLRKRQIDRDRFDEEDDREDEGRRPSSVKNDWSSPRSAAPTSSLRTIGDTRADSESESTTSRKSRVQSTVGAPDSIASESGAISDSSDTFVIEGDEEPLLTDEEHVSIASQPLHSPSARDSLRSGDNLSDRDAFTSPKIDTRTVHLATTDSSY